MKPILPPRHFIAVDRDAHKLELWSRRRLGKKLALERTYPIAVGKDGYRTPRGLYIIDDRDFRPSWTLGNYDWVREAGLEPYSVVPYGHPANPIRGRWLGFKDAAGVGIHGTADESSIGKDASHGCVRMRVRDIEELYPKAPLFTPVYIA
jgi:lipoprotein-anchoring transpeptidase ErfK/SrfK